MASVAAIEVCSYVAGFEMALLLKREPSIQHMALGLEERPLCGMHYVHSTYMYGGLYICSQEGQDHVKGYGGILINSLSTVPVGDVILCVVDMRVLRNINPSSTMLVRGMIL